MEVVVRTVLVRIGICIESGEEGKIEILKYGDDVHVKEGQRYSSDVDVHVDKLD